MSESLRKKIILTTLPLALVWAFFNFPTEKAPVAPGPATTIAPLTQISVPASVTAQIPGQIKIVDKQSESWGQDPFRSYSYRTKPAATGSQSLEWSLAGIIYNNVNPLAFINKKTVRIGDKVGNATVIAIEKESVTIEYRGRKIKLNLNKG